MRILIALAIAVVLSSAGCMGTKPDSTVLEEKPEVLFLGPVELNAVLYDLIFSYLVESGVYIETDAQQRLPEKLPRDLSQYKVIIADRDLPCMRDSAQRRRLEKWGVKHGNVIFHCRPATINWNSNDQELYDVFNEVTQKFGARLQHPAFLRRNAARSDKDVIVGAVSWQIKAGYEKWYMIGNDVAFMHFEGMLKAADLYQLDEVRQYVIQMCNQLLEQKPNCAVFAGHLLPEFQQPGFEPFLAQTLKNMRKPEDLRRQADRMAQNRSYVRGETLSPMRGFAARGALYNEYDYFDPIIDIFKYGHEALFDPETRLWAHGGKPGGQHAPPWGRGYGWMLQGLSALAEYLPKDHPDYMLVMKYMEETAEGLRKYQDPETGMWHNLVDDPATRLEVSGTGMIVEAYCRAWRAGVCQTPEVKDMLTKAWYGLKAHTLGPRTFSFLWGMGTADRAAYAAKPSSGTAYLVPLAGSEYVKTFGPLVP